MSSITLRFLAEPSTVNFGGKVHGGTVMKWIDEAGYACATSWAKRYCVTVSVGSIRFQKPIRIGDQFSAAIRYKPFRYPDEVGDYPVRITEEPAALRVVCIHAYERSLQMLGQGMTGSIVVEGDGLNHVAPGWARISGRRQLLESR